MPKLNDTVAAKVDEAEDGFKPVEEGVYILQLVKDVDVREGDKAPYWRWEFEIPKAHEGKELQHAGRKFWTNTSLSDAAYFKLKETFKAFGKPTNTDTEELVGLKVKAMITQRVIQGGQRKGDVGNEISQLFPLDYDETAVAEKQAEDAKSGDNSEPLF